MTKKLSSACLAFFLTCSLLIAGCSKPVSAQEIAANTLEAYPEVDSVRMDMHFSMSTELSGGDEPSAMSLTGDLAAAIGNVAREMQMSMTMKIDVAPEGSMAMSYDVFIVDGWTYSRLDIEPLGEYWTKSPATDETWQDQNQMAQQAEFLRDAMDVTRLGTETIGGVSCYILEYRPDPEKFMAWALSQGADTGMDMNEFDMNEFEDIPDEVMQILQDLTIKQWIAQDSYYIMKTELDFNAEMSEKDLDPTATGDETVKMHLYYEMLFYDYNMPVTITLPPEALTATEFTYPY